MRQLIAGNWKMNGLGADLVELETISRALAAKPSQHDVLVCPPATLISRAFAVAKGAVPIGAQDCHAQAKGAFTGDVSAEMLRDAGASTVIVGHSERRRYHHETSAEIAAKAEACWRAGLTAIICVGETEAEREAGDAARVCAQHVTGSVPRGAMSLNTAIAYEPVWAIGTGKTPTTKEIAEMHVHIRKELVGCLGEAGRAVRILYGGSVNPSNAKEILGIREVEGALIGGASLKARDFLAILSSAPAKR